MELHLRLATILTELLENRFKIGNIRFGLDAIIGVVPVFGDIIGFFLSMYIVWIGKQAKLPDKKIQQMTRNIIIDLVLGLIPIAGDIADVFYRANSKNLKILKDHLKHPKDNIIEGEIVS